MKSGKDNSILRLLLILGDEESSGVLYTKELEFKKSMGKTADPGGQTLSRTPDPQLFEFK